LRFIISDSDYRHYRASFNIQTRGTCPPSLLTGPSSRQSPPPSSARSLRTTCSRWSTSNYISKWENYVKLLTFLNLAIICRPIVITFAGENEQKCMSASLPSLCSLPSLTRHSETRWPRRLSRIWNILLLSLMNFATTINPTISIYSSWTTTTNYYF
jgi:hypothetical protein